MSSSTHQKLTLAVGAALSAAALAYLGFSLWEKRTETKISKIRTIRVFDFDGTLFRNPIPSKELWGSLFGKLLGEPWRDGLGWYQDPLTLSEPYVPKRPGSEWFNDSIVEQVKKALANPEEMVILLSGRNVGYEAAIRGILEGTGLDFAKIGLKPLARDVSTFDFKEKYLKSLMQHVGATNIEIYEDRDSHIRQFESMIQRWRMGNEFGRPITGKVHKVTEVSTILPEELEVQLVKKLIDKYMLPGTIVKSTVRYVGVQLDQTSRQVIRSAFPIPPGWDEKLDHMTMHFGAPIQDIKKEYGVDLKEIVELKAISLGRSDKALAIQVTGVKSDNKLPHVTIAVSPIGKPKDSNEIQNWTPIEKPILISGIVKEYKSYEIVRGIENNNNNNGDSPSPSDKTPNKPPQTSKKIQVGHIVKQLHPNLTGPQLGKAMNLTQQWMTDMKVENIPENIDRVSEWIKKQDFESLPATITKTPSTPQNTNSTTTTSAPSSNNGKLEQSERKSSSSNSNSKPSTPVKTPTRKSHTNDSHSKNNKY